MSLRDDLAADFPQPRDDEPESLRQDILDELADHLQCGLRRELLVNPTDQHSAYQRVLDRFGDPAAIAHKLWFDAIKENVVSQRITTIAIVLLTVLCGGLFLFTWQTQAANRDLIQQQQATLAEFVQSLKELRDRTPPTQPSEWNQVMVRCVYDQPGGPPVTGATLVLTRFPQGTSDLPPLTETTTMDGTVDFGTLRYGQYTLQVTLQNQLTLKQNVSVRVGQGTDLEIVCPRTTTAVVQPRGVLEVPLPKDFEGQAWFCARVHHHPETINDYWTFPANSAKRSDYDIFLRPDGKSLVIEAGEPQPWCRMENITPGDKDNSLDGIHRFAQSRYQFTPEAPWSDTVQLPVGQYVFRYTSLGITDPNDETKQTALLHINIPKKIDRTPPTRGESLRAARQNPAMPLKGLANPFQATEWTFTGDTWAVKNIELALRIPTNARLTEIRVMFPDQADPTDWDNWLQNESRLELFACKSSPWVDEAHGELTLISLGLRPDVSSIGRSDRQMNIRTIDKLPTLRPLPSIVGPFSGTGSGFLNTYNLDVIVFPDEEELIRKLANTAQLVVRPIDATTVTERGQIPEVLTAELQSRDLPTISGVGNKIVALGLISEEVIVVPPEPLKETQPEADETDR